MRHSRPIIWNSTGNAPGAPGSQKRATLRSPATPEELPLVTLRGIVHGLEGQLDATFTDRELKGVDGTSSAKQGRGDSNVEEKSDSDESREYESSADGEEKDDRPRPNRHSKLEKFNERKAPKKLDGVLAHSRVKVTALLDQLHPEERARAFRALHEWFQDRQGQATLVEKELSAISKECDDTARAFSQPISFELDEKDEVAKHLEHFVNSLRFRTFQDEESPEELENKLAAARATLEKEQEQDQTGISAKVDERREEVAELKEELQTLLGSGAAWTDLGDFGEDEAEQAVTAQIEALRTEIQDEELQYHRAFESTNELQNTNLALSNYISSVKRGYRNEWPLDPAAWEIVSHTKDLLKFDRTLEIHKIAATLSDVADTYREDMQGADEASKQRTSLEVDLEAKEEELRRLSRNQNLLKASQTIAATMTTEDLKNMEQRVNDLGVEADNQENRVVQREALRRCLRESTDNLDRLLDEACQNLAQESLEGAAAYGNKTAIQGPTTWQKHSIEVWSQVEQYPSLMHRLILAREGTRLGPNFKWQGAFRRGVDKDSSKASLHFGSKRNGILVRCFVLRTFTSLLKEVRMKRLQAKGRSLWHHLLAVEGALAPTGNTLNASAMDILAKTGGTSSGKILANEVKGVQSVAPTTSLGRFGGVPSVVLSEAHNQAVVKLNGAGERLDAAHKVIRARATALREAAQAKAASTSPTPPT